MEINDSEEAGVISMESLLGGNIGEPKVTKKEEAEKDLEETLAGGKKDDFFDLGLNDQISDDNEPADDSNKPDKVEVGKPEDVITVTNDGVKEPETSPMYKNALKSIFGDIGSIIQEVDGVEEETSFDDLEVDLETFKDIALSKIAEIEEKANQNKISAEGISEFTKSLIEVEKNGGNIKQLLEYKDTYSDPLAALDMDTEQGQVDAIFLRLKASGRTDKEIQYTIKGYKEDGILGDMAHTAKEELEGAVKAKIEAEKERASENAKAMEEQMKSYRKELKENLNRFELKDSIKSKLTDYATKKDANGQYELDKLYRENRLNPERAADLALFLADKEEYDKQVSKKEVTEVKLESARKLKVVKRADSSTPDIVQRHRDKDIIPLDTLK